MKKYNITVNGTSYEVEVEEIEMDSSNTTAIKSESKQKTIPKKVEPVVHKEVSKVVPNQSVSDSATTIEAPMPGAILDIKVKVGDMVAAGDVVLILEAMKMENEITSPASGKVSAIHTSKGNNVGSGDVLISLN